jgi:hypothetical protein
MQTQIETSRVHRTWADKLKLWRRAYETKIWDGRSQVIGRGSTPEASKEAAEGQWVEEQTRTE